ncbi:methyltransferase [Lihuaxuella thermophila]|uniref:Phospholipid methyltransferase n=1 Tax=Lihuaxuella thermophila TaxID=1173111 RepID=A0A1H8BEU7_9BACL|nr:methyltransferase [Lihuaxuella thermophila]SEM81385.1 Phospholipid methyltransferase [Lihuaxuella thermophila]
MKNSVYSHVKAILAAPFNVTVTIPLLILVLSGDLRIGWAMGGSLIVGTLLLSGGLYLLVTTIRLFARKGEGTLAPWNPPQKLVVAGPYRYVRNPMYSGVLFITGRSGCFRLLLFTRLVSPLLDADTCSYPLL